MTGAYFNVAPLWCTLEIAACRSDTRTRMLIGIGVGLTASPSHTTVHTGPYTAVR